MTSRDTERHLLGDAWMTRLGSLIQKLKCITGRCARQYFEIRNRQNLVMLLLISDRQGTMLNVDSLAQLSIQVQTMRE